VALQRDLAGYFLMTVDENDTVVRANVTPGGRIGEKRIIQEGLTGDQRVIVNGLQRARPGIKVEITEPETPAEEGE
jgi:multidrug efflux pump subunit AcrA (membrane-fusion protein)